MLPHVINREALERGFESHPKTVPQYCHTALTAVATEYCGASTVHPRTGRKGPE
jgi:hypothetical protein